jgi:tol-pal system protein YbgF
MCRFIILIVGCGLLSGCSVFDLEKKVSKLERSLSDLRALQAEQGESISSLDSQIKLIAGRMEELEFSQTKRMGSDLTALKDDLSALRKRIPPPPGVPIAELEADEGWASSLPDETRRIFLDGLAMLREGKFADAVPLFQNVVEQTGSSDKCGAALFWLGVSHDGLLDNRAALKAYSEIVSVYPKSHRAPASLARQAEVFVRLGDSETGQVSLKKLIKDYPKSPEAVEAKARLKQL